MRTYADASDTSDQKVGSADEEQDRVLKPLFPRRFRKKAEAPQAESDGPVSLAVPRASWQSLLCTLAGAIKTLGHQVSQVSQAIMFSCSSHY